MTCQSEPGSARAVVPINRRPVRYLSSRPLTHHGALRTFFILAGAMLLLGSCKRPPDVQAPGIYVPDFSQDYDRQAPLERALPEFSLQTLDGRTLSSESLKGKVTIINFWATWCGPCIVEIPEFVTLYDEWSDEPFEIVGVSEDIEGFDIVIPFAEDFQISYPLVMDSDGTLGESFGGVYALPTTFLVNAEGMIVYRYLGLFPFEDLRDEMDALLREARALLREARAL